RQPRAIGKEANTAGGFGLLAGGDAAHPGGKAIVKNARQHEVKLTLAVFRVKRRVIRNRGRVRAKAFQAHFAFDTKSAPDGADANPFRSGHLSCPQKAESRAPEGTRQISL